MNIDKGLVALPVREAIGCSKYMRKLTWIRVYEDVIKTLESEIKQ